LGSVAEELPAVEQDGRSGLTAIDGGRA